MSLNLIVWWSVILLLLFGDGVMERPGDGVIFPKSPSLPFTQSVSRQIR